MSSIYFNKDREYKYFWGLFRLSVVLIISFTLNSSNKGDNKALWLYLYSYRWIPHIYIGVMGAMVNVKCFNTFTNIAILIIAGVLIIYDIFRFDISLCIYLLKTFCGDFLAGKLDTIEWKIGLIINQNCIIIFITHVS